MTSPYAQRYPCMRSGYCCTVRPCPYGAPKSDTDNACKFLEADGEVAPGILKYRCGQYDWIMANVPERDWQVSPAFGQGCSSPLFNTSRDRIIAATKDD